MAESKEELKSLLMKVEEESEKAGFKLNIQNSKIMASGPINSWQIFGKTMATVTYFIFLGSTITEGDCSHEIKRHLLLVRKALTNLDSTLKTKDITLLTKVHLVKAMVFPVVFVDGRVGQWRKLSTEELMLLNCGVKLLRVPWTVRRSNQSFLNKISPEYSLEGLMLKLRLQYFGHLMWRTDSLEKTLMLDKIEAREEDDREWDGWMASPTGWTWVWARSGRWWWTGKPVRL